MEGSFSPEPGFAIGEFESCSLCPAWEVSWVAGDSEVEVWAWVTAVAVSIKMRVRIRLSLIFIFDSFFVASPDLFRVVRKDWPGYEANPNLLTFPETS